MKLGCLFPSNLPEKSLSILRVTTPVRESSSYNAFTSLWVLAAALFPLSLRPVMDTPDRKSYQTP